MGINSIDEFITFNNLKLTRTNEELIERAKIEQDGFLNFGMEVLIEFFPYELGKTYMTDEYNEEIKEGTKVWTVCTLQEAVTNFLGYMKFAWGKALNERGISASRSITKLKTWLWLMGRDDLVEVIRDNDNYNPYGAPALIKVCQALSIKVPTFAKHPRTH